MKNILSNRIKDVLPSATLRITAMAKKMKSEGIDVISFGAGEPDFNTPDSIKEAAHEAINENFTRYTPASGIPELKKGIAEKLKKDNALDYSWECISVCSGAKHAIYNCIQVLCNAGDEVLIPAPYWVSYPEMARLAEAKPVIIEASEETNFKVSVEVLRKHLTPSSKILVLNSPSNPTGMVYAPEELEAIARFVCENDLFVISDEIYEKLIYDGKHVSIASFGSDIKGRTVIANGFSKSHCMTGWRSGYTAAAPDIARAINNLLSHSTSNVTSITQKASLEALNVPESAIEDMRDEFMARRDYIVERLNGIKGVRCLKPSGAFYVFPNIRRMSRGNSMEVTESLLRDAKIAVVPGSAFGAEYNLRLSYACSLDDIRKGLDRFSDWANSGSC